MDAALLLKLLHILSVIWTVGGILGRWVVLTRAARADDMRSVTALVGAAGPFERLMAIPGSFAVLVTGLLTAWAQGRPFLGSGSNWLLVSIVLFFSLAPVIAFAFVPGGRRFEQALEDADKRDAVTPELRTAFGDRAVAVARTYELVVIVAVLVLMVLKPF